MEAWLSDSVLREENEVIEKKIQGYAQRMSELETALVDEEEQGRREIAQVQKNIQDIEIVIQEIDVRIRSVVAGDG